MTPRLLFLPVCAVCFLASAPVGQYAVQPEVVVDTLTSLTWQRTLANTTFTRQAADAYCRTLRVGGMSGWRLPTKKELATLLEPRETPTPITIDEQAFPGTPPTWFWTSTRDVQDPEFAWAIGFRRGFSIESYPVTEGFRVRCVR